MPVCGRAMLYMCIEYHMKVNINHVSAQSIDEHRINVHYYYYDMPVFELGHTSMRARTCRYLSWDTPVRELGCTSM